MRTPSWRGAMVVVEEVGLEVVKAEDWGSVMES
jgi:hypothetical protein